MGGILEVFLDHAQGDDGRGGRAEEDAAVCACVCLTKPGCVFGGGETETFLCA